MSIRASRAWLVTLNAAAAACNAAIVGHLVNGAWNRLAWVNAACIVVSLAVAAWVAWAFDDTPSHIAMDGHARTTAR